jgi:hypothetical protein
MRHRTTALVCSALLYAASAHAADVYVDPVNGSASGDGSAGKPWRTIQDVVDGSAPIKPGDTIWLRSGYHGVLAISGRYNAGW